MSGLVCYHSYMTNNTRIEAIRNKARALTAAQSTKSLIDSLALLELGAPEPSDDGMREWIFAVDNIEAVLIERFDCDDAHTDYILSDEFEADARDGARTSYRFLAKVAEAR